MAAGKAAGRPVRKAAPAPAPARLEFSVSEETATLKLSLRRRNHEMTGLLFRERGGGVETTYDISSTEHGRDTTVQVDLRELVLERGLRGALDVYVLWTRKPPTSQTSADAEGAEVGAHPTKVVKQRLGGLRETERPPQMQWVVIEGIDVRLEMTVKGNLSLRIDSPTRTAPRCVTESYTHDGHRTTMVCDVKTNNHALLDAKAVVLGRRSGTRLVTDAPFAWSAERSRDDHGLLHYDVRAKFDLMEISRRISESDDILEFVLEVRTEANEEPYQLTFRLPDTYPEHRLKSTPSTVTEQSGSRTHLFIPYLTYRQRRLAYRVEHFDSGNYRYLRRMLRLSWLFPIAKPFTRIWLVGEVPYKAQDNGLHFFRYLRTERPNCRAYYVIDAKSPDREKLMSLGNVIDRFSRQHILYSLLASRLVSSHHAEYLFASRDRAVVRRTRGVRIFLQHGITAMKNVTPIYARQRTNELPTERFIVASELEQRIVIEDYGFRPYQVPITGFARFDELLSAGDTSEPRLLVMPTWREGIRVQNFLESEYFRRWYGFLTDPRLQSVLEQYELRVTMVLHPNMRLFADFFNLPNVDVIRQEDVEVQQLIKTSRILITDFSSVAWDFSFLRRPVLYFQFDQHLLAGERAPHIDFVEYLPGPVAATVDGLVDELSRVVARGCTMTDEYWARAQMFLTYRDQNSCARIYDIIAKAWGPRTLFDRVRNAGSVQRWWWSFRTGPSYFPWMQRLYRLAAVLPRNDEVVVECDRGAHYGDAPRYLYERLIERGVRPNVAWVNNTTLRLTDPRTQKIRRHSPAYYWRLGRARYWINNQNFPPALAKPAKTTFLQTWHGTPLKRMQHDVENMMSRDPEYQQRAARLTSYWDFLLSGSPYATACFRSAFRFTGTILEEGYPRNDVFSWDDAAERARNARARLGLVNDTRKILLYAPTFRDDNRPGANWRHRLELDVARLEAEFGNEYVLIVRFHQLVRESIADLTESHPNFVIDGSSYNDIQELLLVSDVLITDYSSLFFDFAVLQRPILFFTYDLDRYRDALRGFYLNFEASAPGPLLGNNDELVSALHGLDEIAAQYLPRLREFAATYAPKDDGGASDRVIDVVFGLSSPQTRLQP
ncbi:MAG: CDP-glycerol glycerophosphotransferase family protein [Microlunatus sp.]